MADRAVSDPQQVKARIQAAYSKATANRSVSYSRPESGIDHVFRDVRLYGREAGIDFVDTHFDILVQEAVGVADCGEASLTIQVYRWGRSAMAGMAVRLEELTALRIDTTGNTVKLTWANTTPSLI